MKCVPGLQPCPHRYYTWTGMPRKSPKANPAEGRVKDPKSPAMDGEPQPAPENTYCTIVGVGASAGGLEAFTEVLSHMPPDPGMALVLVQHLDPKHHSVLAELLARATPMRVVEIKDGITVKMNHVYVIPPNKTLILSNHTLRLLPKGPGLVQMPIDAFFRSMAEHEGSKSIGVILSGTASDGTLGLKAIKAEGGITFCQNEESAKYDGMPRSAIAAGCVDFVLPPKEIAHELVRLCRHPYVVQQPENLEPAMQELDFAEIFSMLRSATGVDFTFYKHATIRRRIQRRMALNRADTPEKYIAFIRQNRGELQSLYQDILINVTGFFREPGMFDFLKAKIFPVLCQDRKPDDPIRVWVPGCATGEEAYSVGITLLEYLRDHSIETTIQIFGTDLSEPALERARAGIYPESIAAEVSAERLQKFFVKTSGSYQITRPVRDMCIFARQNLTKDPPFSKLDLITCRNVLIYLGPVLQQRLMRVFHYALKPSGFLALGISETVGSSTEMFHAMDRKQRIYARKNTPAAVSLDLGAAPQDTHVATSPRKPEDWSSLADFQRKVDQLLLSRYAPPGVLVDSELKILEFRGRTAPYLEHSSGEASLSLMKMGRAGLGMEVLKLVQRAKSKDATVRSETLQLGRGESLRNARISVIPVRAPHSNDFQFVVLFEEVPSGKKDKGTKAGAKVGTASTATVRRISDLEQELGSTKLYLQSVIEEQEATTEELKSANEEIQSSNAELQSTNEELLTAKEELQSTNEELTTLNEEMQSRNAELAHINNDLSNLLSSVNIPIVMVGNDLRIRRFTPQAEKVLNLLPTDLGRPIGDFRPKVHVPDLERMFLDVIGHLKVEEREVRDEEGRYYSMWIRPYRTADNKIDGAVMALFDVTERKNLAEARYRRLFEAARDGILIVDWQTGEILDANPFVANLSGYSRSSLLGQKLWDSGLLTRTDLQDLAASMTDRQTWQRAVKLILRTGERVDVEIVATVYQEGERRVIQLHIRDLGRRDLGRRDSSRGGRADLVPQDAQKLQIVGRMAGTLARDFNNLLTSIIGYSNRVEHTLGAEHGVAAEIRAIRTAGEKAAELTRQLLAFGRSPMPSENSFNLNDMVSDLEQVVRVMLSDGMELRLTLSPEPVRLMGERFQVEQILLELVSNARDAMPRGGTLTIETRNESVDAKFTEEHPAVPPGEYGALLLTDTGEGGSQDRLSAPAFSLGRGAQVIEGLEGTIRAANGYYWSNTETGRGTTAAVYFLRETRRDDREGLEATGGHETVLLVDSDSAVRQLAASVLRDKGYAVHVATDGPDALRMTREDLQKVDLLVADIIMVNMSGAELGNRLLESHPNMKILYMTGDTEEKVSDYVTGNRRRILRKPFTPRELVNQVRHVLDEEWDANGGDADSDGG